VKNRIQISLFLLFFVSGFCGLLYQIVWVRLAFASFGIITPVLSVVLSVFMLGLSAGSWAAGRSVSSFVKKWRVSAIYLYAAAEALIGLGAFAVPQLFVLGEKSLLNFGESGSLGYLVLSAVWIAVSIFPWCFLMGTTFPLMLAFVGAEDARDPKMFSFLYLANVLGALLGVLITACVFVELAGFRSTLLLGGAANFSIACTAIGLGRRSARNQTPATPGPEVEKHVPERETRLHPVLLFTTGFVSLAMEVIWTRAFTPVLGTQVYAFAVLLFVYLLATWKGTSDYRRQTHSGGTRSTPALVALLPVFALLPIVINDPRLNPAGIGSHVSVFLVLVSIFPFCACLGYLTPKLIDERSNGNPGAAGNAYALNVLGCILGPLFASYLLLPWMGTRGSALMLALPMLGLHFITARRSTARLRWGTGLCSALLVGGAWLGTVGYEDPRLDTEHFEVRRDHTATVISFGQGFERKLLVNGIGITDLSAVPKFMAHLPMAFHQCRPENALVICFGMGTSYRSMLSWGQKSTAVELVPSVKEAFGFYHPDAPEILKNPQGRVVIDDGRRFLKRTREYFDVITIDPPPPAEAAGSSLLYSEEFYELVKQRLRPGGVLQQWFAVGEDKILQAVVRSLKNSFPYVRVFPSVQGWGYHFLASMDPLEGAPAEELVRRFPDRARQDALEWSEAQDLRAELDRLLSKEIPIGRLLNEDPRVTIRDDRPFNEYFLIRRVLGHSRFVSSNSLAAN